MNCARKMLLACLVALVPAVFLTACSRPVACPVTYGHIAFPNATNPNLLSVVITNESDYGIYFGPAPAQVSSNGVWSGNLKTTGMHLQKLGPNRAVIVNLPVSALSTNVRVPLLWGYQYGQITNETRESIAMWMSGRGLRGLLYTTYMTHFVAATNVALAEGVR